MSETVESLKCARSLIEKGWTKGAFARDAEGTQVVLNDAKATAFCIIGACRWSVLDAGSERIYQLVMAELYRTVMLKKTSRSLSEFNDAANGVQDVLSVFDDTIARLEVKNE